MGDAEDKMTIEYLREVYRREKSSMSLWEDVRPDFYVATAELFRAQRLEYDAELQKDMESIRSENFSNTIFRTKRLFKDIINIRMDKICTLALRGADKADNKIDCLTKEEKEYYDRVLLASQDHISVINRLCGSASYRIPDVSTTPVKPTIPVRQEVPTPHTEYVDPDEEPLDGATELDIDTVPDDGVVKIDYNPDMDEPEPEMDIPEDQLDSAMGTKFPSQDPVPSPKPEPTAESSDLLLIRILADLPTIAGVDRNYDLRKEDVVYLPALFANVLVNRNLAQILSVSP